MATTHRQDKGLRDGDDSHANTAVSAPAWAVHNPPRPARDTLLPHGGGGGLASESHVHQHTRAAHKATVKSSRIKITKHHTPRDNEQEDETIGTERAGGRVEYQVVIDKIGHGVAPDQPELLPTAAALTFAAMETDGTKEAEVQSVAQVEWQWKHRDSIELGLVGAAVLLVAAVVIAVARRQQRAYDRQQQQQQQQQQLTAEAVATLDLGPVGLRFDTSNIRVTRDDDEIGTPESVVEGVV